MVNSKRKESDVRRLRQLGSICKLPNDPAISAGKGNGIKTRKRKDSTVYRLTQDANASRLCASYEAVNYF